MIIRCDAITRLNYINGNSKLLYDYYFKRRRIGQGYKRVGKKNRHSSMWCEFEMMGENDDDNSELSEHTRFLTKGAFLLTPSHDLSLDKAANICDKLNFRGSFSLTKTATGILFKFSEPDDYQQVFRKGFHKVTGGRLYRKVSIPCRPQKTFSLLVYEVPSDLPEDDIRASLYRYCSVVEVTRVPQKIDQSPGSPPPIRITVASLDEYNSLLQQGLDFYGATYFPTEPLKKDQLRGSKEKLLPVFDSAGFSRIPAPPTRTLKPIRS